MKSKILFLCLFIFFVPAVVSASCTDWSCDGACVVNPRTCGDVPANFLAYDFNYTYSGLLWKWCVWNPYTGTNSSSCSSTVNISGGQYYKTCRKDGYQVITKCDGTQRTVTFDDDVNCDSQKLFRGWVINVNGDSCDYAQICLKKQRTYVVEGTVEDPGVDCSNPYLAGRDKYIFEHRTIILYYTDDWGDFCICGSAGSSQRRCQIPLGSPPDCSCSCPDGATYQNGGCIYPAGSNIVFSYVVCKGCNLSETFNVDWRTWYPMPKLPDVPLSIVRYGIPSGTNYDRYEWYCSITGGYKLLSGVTADVGYVDMLQALTSNGCKSRLEKGATLYDAFIYAFKTPSCGDPAYELWSSNSGSVGIAGGAGAKGFGQSLIKGMKKQGQTFGGGGGCEKRE